MTQGFRSLRVLALLVLLAGAAPLAAQSDIAVRIMPPNKAQFLQGQKFDIRVEASTGGSNNITSLRVFLDDQEITTDGTVDAGAGKLRNWTLRNTTLRLGNHRLGEQAVAILIEDAMPVVPAKTARTHP